MCTLNVCGFFVFYHITVDNESEEYLIISNEYKNARLRLLSVYGMVKMNAKRHRDTSNYFIAYARSHLMFAVLTLN